MRLAAGLCPDPLGGCSAPPDSLAVIRGEMEGLGMGGGREERDRIGMESGRREGKRAGKGEGWLDLDIYPGAPSYATGMEEENGSAVTSAPRHVRKRATLNAGYRVRHVGVPDALPSIQ